MVSSELQQAISVLIADRENGILRFEVNKQVQCTPAPAPGNGGQAASNNPSCQFALRIHQ